MKISPISEGICEYEDLLMECIAPAEWVYRWGPGKFGSGLYCSQHLIQKLTHEREVAERQAAEFTNKAAGYRGMVNWITEELRSLSTTEGAHQ